MLNKCILPILTYGVLDSGRTFFFCEDVRSAEQADPEHRGTESEQEAYGHVTQSVMLYVAPVYTGAASNRRKLRSVQRKAALRTCSAFHRFRSRPCDC